MTLLFSRMVVGKTILLSMMGARTATVRRRPTTASLFVRRNYCLSPGLTRKLDAIVRRHEALQALIEESPEDGFSHRKELSSLAQMVAWNDKIKQIQDEEISVRELIQEAAEDEEMQQELQTELESLEASKTRIHKKIRTALLPKDENDTESDAIVEIRAGTGGDEATLFAGELMEAYVKTAKFMRWELEVMSESRTDIGGIKETVLGISARRGGGGAGMGFASHMDDDNDDDDDDDSKAGIGPYGLFRYESGVHRVQRVPVNDTRIQTSACSVAVLPMIADDKAAVDKYLPLSELKIETMRSSGAGGQHVNTTESAVRITHIATGITASIQDERSQHKNKEKALKLVTARVREAQREQNERELGATRSGLLGRGDRSERIRTYNYPQDRVTDHRCKETAHGISTLLEGGADGGLVATFYPYLRDLVQEELLNEMETEA